jgi:CRP/FNR family cyclic AMP-dependent transcriptional regulator
MASVQDGVVSLLDADPELGAAVVEAERAAAAAAASARTIELDAGRWEPPRSADPAHLGLLVLSGLVTRTVTIAGRDSVELLAQGDLLRPWVRLGPDATVTPSVAWEVLEPTELAVLDADFARRVARWPELTAVLLERTVMRSRMLAFALAISHVRRVDERLLLLLWHLADRWGRVTVDGVVVPLRLTHRALATLVGAQRPSVSTALGSLRSGGMLERRDDGSWLLRGDPVQVLGAIRAR